MPYGYLFSTVLLALGTLAALAPAPRRYPVVGVVSFVLGLVVNELPFLALTLLAGSTALVFGQGDVESAGAWAVVGVAALTAPGLVVVARRSLGAPRIVRSAVAAGLGDAAAERVGRRTPWASILFRPLWVHRRDVRRTRNLAYGDAGRRHRLDVYRSRAPRTGEPAPVIVYLHGGGYFSGHKNREGRLLLYRLAARGHVCVSANYRLRPHTDFAGHLADLQRVLAWVRAHIAEYGGDPDRVILAGSSAGAHLAAVTALSPAPEQPVVTAPLLAPDQPAATAATAPSTAPDQPAATAGRPAPAGPVQPAATDVTAPSPAHRPLAAICLYGYYGHYYGMGPQDLPVSSPVGYAADAAPPVFVAHGDRDTLVSVTAAREFVAHLRAASPSPVVYAELPGAHHSFDLFRSVRHEAVIDGVEAFVSWVAGAPAGSAGQRGTTSSPASV
ncbi:alpha/beta hydrolase [Jiangella alba]|uniref:Acetyl esterase/lipase n=1 Tax=Jiangella alba TaxID=561176 RepID=A0A1H5M4A2_9ACTN|nr:alpha/beta hydrolase [Jiangella alba]SEE84023.1 Acetyl esterase/lipase [Jiangella alba]